MGMVPSGTLASMVLAIKNMMWYVPEHWTLEDAATVPVVYATVSYHELKSKLGSLLLSNLNLSDTCLSITTVWLLLTLNLSDTHFCSTPDSQYLEKFTKQCLFSSTGTMPLSSATFRPALVSTTFL
jgi:fatty acid synthase